MDERCSGEVAFVTRCFHWWYFIFFYFLVVIAHFHICIPQPTWNCMSYKERSEPHCTLSPNAIPSQVNTVLRAKINILLPWSTAEHRQISFPYPLYSTELLIDPNSQRQSTYFTCLVQKLCFQEKSLLVLTYHNDKNNICGGKKTALKLGAVLGLGSLDWIEAIIVEYSWVYPCCAISRTAIWGWWQHSHAGEPVCLSSFTWWLLESFSHWLQCNELSL